MAVLTRANLASDRYFTALQNSGPRKQNQAQGGDGGGSPDGVLDHGHGQGEYIMMEELLRIVNYDTILRWRLNCLYSGSEL